MSVVSRNVGTYRAGEIAVTMLDRLYKPNSTRYGVVYSHGATASGDAAAATQYRDVPNALTDAGYPLLSPDLGASLSSWGNDDAITAMTAAYTWLTSTGPAKAKTGKVFVYAGSMGALTALNWARQNTGLVGALALVIPALDLDDIYQNDKGSFRASIGTAYGVTHPTAIPGLATHSPVAYPADVTGFPIHVWASSNDPIASTYTAAQTWAAAVGPNVTVESLGAVGHGVTGLDPLTVVSFFDANGGRA